MDFIIFFLHFVHNIVNIKLYILSKFGSVDVRDMIIKIISPVILQYYVAFSQDMGSWNCVSQILLN